MLHRFLHTFITHFIPHDGNDYAPHFLRRAATVGMFGLVLLSFTMANIQALLWQQSDWLVGAILPAVVVDLTNQERALNAAPQVVRSSVLDAAATLKAQDMAKNSYFSHDSPTGVTPWFWFEAVNYPFVHAGENLAVYFTDSREVVEAWMNSPSHRANIVDSDYREIGIGTARGTYKGYDTIFVVQLFGTPAAAIQPAPVVVAAPTPVPVFAVVEEALATIGSTSEAVAAIESGEVEIIDLLALNQTPEVAGETITEEAVITEPAVGTPEMAVAADAEPALVPPDTLAVPQRKINPQVFDSYDVLYSDLAASSTKLFPAVLSVPDNNGGTTAPMVARLATEPNHLLQNIYIVIGFMVVLALLTSVLLEWRHHRPIQTAHGLLLLVIMCALFTIHSMITGGAVIL